MPNWKKVLLSGSKAAVYDITASHLPPENGSLNDVVVLNSDGHFATASRGDFGGSAKGPDGAVQFAYTEDGGVSFILSGSGNFIFDEPNAELIISSSGEGSINIGRDGGISSGDTLGNLNFIGTGSSVIEGPSATIQAVALQNFDANTKGTKLEFYTADDQDATLGNPKLTISGSTIITDNNITLSSSFVHGQDFQVNTFINDPTVRGLSIYETHIPGLEIGARFGYNSTKNIAVIQGVNVGAPIENPGPFVVNRSNNRVHIATPTASLQFSASLQITGDIWASGSTGHITSSGNISSSGYISASNAYFAGPSHIANPTDINQATLLLGRTSGDASIKSTDNYFIAESSGVAAALNWWSSDKVILANGGGNVGIGLTSPTEDLTVKGNIYASGSEGIEGYITSSHITSSGHITARQIIAVTGSSSLSQPYDNQGTLIAYGTGNNLIHIQTPDNTKDAGLAFRNSGGAYTHTIYRTDEGSNNADLKIAGGAANQVVSSLEDLIILKGGTGSFSGSLGIGQMDPGAKLHVNGNISASGTLTVNTIDNGSTSVVLTRGVNGLIEKRSADSRIFGSTLIDKSSNLTATRIPFASDTNTLTDDDGLVYNSGDGSAQDYLALHGARYWGSFSSTPPIIDPASSFNRIQFGLTDTGSRLEFQTENKVSFDGNNNFIRTKKDATDRGLEIQTKSGLLTISGSGDKNFVGIGFRPQVTVVETLQNTGEAYWSVGCPTGEAVESPTQGSNTWQLRYKGTVVMAAVTGSSKGYIGIGDINPDKKLGIKDTRDDSHVVRIENLSENAGTGVANASKGLLVRVNGSSNNNQTYIEFQRDGGNTAGRIKRSANSIQWAPASDRRLKTDIKDLPNGLETLLKIQPREFKWANSNEPTVGFIAQELHEIYPIAAQKGADENVDFKENPWTVAPIDLIPLLIKSVQEQQHVIEELKTRIQDLENG